MISVQGKYMSLLLTIFVLFLSFLIYLLGSTAIPLVLLLSIFIFFYDSLIALQLISGILFVIPSINIQEPEFYHMKISIILFQLMLLSEFIVRRKSLRFLISPTMISFASFFLCLIFRTIFNILDLSFSDSDKYWLIKIYQLINGPIFLFFAGYALQGFPNRSKRTFAFLFVGVIVTGAAVYLMNYEAIREGSVRYLVFHEQEQGRYDPIGFSRIMGIGAVMSLVYLSNIRKSYAKAGATILCGGFIAMMILANERGPALSFLLTVCIYFWYISHALTKDLKILLSVIIILFIGVAGYQQINPDMNRYVSLMSGDLSGESRWYLFGSALKLFLENPLVGLGFGGFNLAEPGMGYPHNIFLEVLTESGIVGFVLFIWFFWCLIQGIRRIGLKQDLRVDIAIFLLLFYLLGAQTSGSLAGNAPLFLFAGMIAGTDAIRRKLVAY